MPLSQDDIISLLAGNTDHGTVKERIREEMAATKETGRSESRLRGAVDIAFRRHASDGARELAKAEKPLGPHLLRVLDSAIQCAKEGLASPQLPFVALQDVLDTLPVRRGPEVWTAVEARKEALSDEFFIPASRGNPPPKLSLLSLANTLLRRLSRGQNTEFCGRVILLMTALLPLSDRSGLNLTGASNTANVTSWDEEEEAVAALEGGDAVGDEDGDEELPVEAAPRQDAQGEGLRSEGGADGGDKSGDGIAIDFAFYRAFWKLQHDMRDAHVAVSDRGAFDGFTDRCHTVLHALESVPVGPATAVGEGEFFAAKYLTSSRLLRLQLRDPQLRRHVLVQVLITLAYLRRAGTGNGEAGARARAALESIHKRTSALLRAVRPHGREFALAIGQVLARETFWGAWKKDKCPAFVLHPGEGSEAERKRGLAVAAQAAKRVRAEAKPLRPTRKLYAPTDLNKLLVEGERQFVPDFAELAGRMEDALDPEMARFAEEGDYDPRQDALYCWRGLRLTARTRLGHMGPAFEDAVRACSANPAVRDGGGAEKGTATEAQDEAGALSRKREGEKEEEGEGEKEADEVPAPKRARRA